MEDQVGQIDQSATKLGNPVVDKQQILAKLERKFSLEQPPLPPNTTSISQLLSSSKDTLVQGVESEVVIPEEDVEAVTEQLRVEADTREAVQAESKTRAELLAFAPLADKKFLKAVMGMIESGDKKRYEGVFAGLLGQKRELKALVEADPTLLAHIQEQFARQAILLHGARDIPKDAKGKDTQKRFTKRELEGIVKWIGVERIGEFLTTNGDTAKQLLGEDFDPEGDVMAQIEATLTEGGGGSIWRIILLLLGVTAVTMVSGARSVQM